MKIGFIGAGQIGSALIQGLLRAEFVSAHNLYVKGGTHGTAEKLQKKLNFQLVNDYQIFEQCEVIFLAVGAQQALPIIRELKMHFHPKSLLISVASGHTNHEVLEILGEKTAVVHAIPNTPVSINAGVIGVSITPMLNEDQKQLTTEILSTLGTVHFVEESLLQTFGTIAGCSPAFVDIFIEALSDAAVLEGLARSLSYEIIAQMMVGTAKLALDTKVHPGVLKDEVTSPGGSTIKGIAALEKNGFRYAIIDAIKQANHKYV